MDESMIEDSKQAAAVLRADGFLGDISALHFVRLHQRKQCMVEQVKEAPHLLLLAGMGAELMVFSASPQACSAEASESSRLLERRVALPHGIHVHGLSSCTDTHGAEGDTYSSVIVAAFGDRYVQVMRLELHCESPGTRLQAALSMVARLPRFCQGWVMEVRLRKRPSWKQSFAAAEDRSRGSLEAAVGISDNSIELWALDDERQPDPRGRPCGREADGGPGSARVGRALKAGRWACQQECLLYSMAVLPSQGWSLNSHETEAASATFYGSPSPETHDHPSLAAWRGQEGSLVASGTVLHGIVLWRVPLDSTAHPTSSGKVATSWQPPVARLLGHQGSIFRISWCASAGSLASVSDDRTLRIWMLPDLAACGSSTPVEVAPNQVVRCQSSRLWDCLLLDGGRTAVTAGEDCSARVWDLCGKAAPPAPGKALPPGAADGATQTAKLLGHQGRALWRVAACDCLLATGGSDGAIKLWQRHQWTRPTPAAGGNEVVIGSAEESGHHAPAQLEGTGSHIAFSLPTCLPPRDTVPASSVIPGREKNGSTEWIRSFQAAGPGMVYVATNLGALHLLILGDGDAMGGSRWATVYRNPRRSPLTCCDAVPLPGHLHGMVEGDTTPAGAVVMGDTSGWAAVLCYSLLDAARHATLEGIDCPGLNCLEWEAHPGSHVLGAFWLRGASSERNLVTANPPGEIRWWRLPDSFQATDEVMKGTGEELARPALVAEAQSPFRKRIRCVDCDIDDGILAAGDQKGNIIVFQRQASTAGDASGPASSVAMLPVATAPGGHGSSVVTCIRLQTIDSPAESSGGGPFTGVTVVSAGHDGVLRTWSLAAGSNGPSAADFSSLRMVGTRKIQHVSAIEGLHWRPPTLMPHVRSSRRDSPELVSGFQAADYVVWSCVDESELLRIKCGGWRRPWATNFHADVSRVEFVVLKDEAIHVHRVRQHKEFCEADPGDSPALLATGKQGRSLQSRHHGREILCCALLRTPSQEPLQDQTTQAGYIAITGAEGGELRRITVNCDDQQRFLPWRNRAESQSPAHGFLPARTDVSGGVLHSPCEITKCIGGTVPRSLVLLPAEPVDLRADGYSLTESTASYSRLLVSANTKEALEAWILTWTPPASPDGACEIQIRMMAGKPPPRGLRPASYAPEAPQLDADLRHLSACGFSSGSLSKGTLSAFLLLGLSDAHLCLMVLEPSRADPWRKVAVLQYHTHPVLSMALAQQPWGPLAVAFTGSSDGRIATWDMATMVEDSRREELATAPLLPSDDEPRAPGLLSYQPIATIEAAHQSGVNSTSAAFVSDSHVVVVSGGDDQALLCSVVELEVEAGGHHRRCRTSGSELCSFCVPIAHTSSIRDVWTDGTLAMSVGLDQRLAVWQISLPEHVVRCSNLEKVVPVSPGDSPSLRMVTCMSVDVLEPATLEVLPEVELLREAGASAAPEGGQPSAMTSSAMSVNPELCHELMSGDIGDDNGSFATSARRGFKVFVAGRGVQALSVQVTI